MVHLLHNSGNRNFSISTRTLVIKHTYSLVLTKRRTHNGAVDPWDLPYISGSVALIGSKHNYGAGWTESTVAGARKTAPFHVSDI